jgi:hypothetical protein
LGENNFVVQDFWCKEQNLVRCFSNLFFLPFKIEVVERGSLELGRGESVGGGGCHCDGETFERDFDASEG